MNARRMPSLPCSVFRMITLAIWQRCAAARGSARARSATAWRSCSRGLANSLRHKSSLAARCDAIVLHADQPGIGDGEAVGVAAEIGQYLLWNTERRLGVDDPFPAAGSASKRAKASGFARWARSPKKPSRPPPWAARSSSRKSRRNRSDSGRAGLSCAG